VLLLSAESPSFRRTIVYAFPYWDCSLAGVKITCLKLKNGRSTNKKTQLKICRIAVAYLFS